MAPMYKVFICSIQEPLSKTFESDKPTGSKRTHRSGWYKKIYKTSNGIKKVVVRRLKGSKSRSKTGDEENLTQDKKTGRLLNDRSRDNS